MSAAQHLFISYAHLDDQPLQAGDLGWITRFHATLAALLSMRLGHQARIWRDQKLQGNDVFDAEIEAQFRQAAVFVSILSSRYLSSEWCTREMREFCDNAQRRGGLVVDNKARVFKVIKTPVDAQAGLPTVLQDVLGYEFFAIKDGAPLELDPAYGQEYAQLYNQKVAKLAWDISQLLKVLPAAQSAGAAQTPAGARAAARPAVYLAECSFDRREARDVIEAELRRLGYPVLPAQRLPADEADYLAAVDQLLQDCALSIHVVGEGYGAVPDGPAARSVVMHQNDLAVARSKAGGLARLIWLPEGTASAHAPQQAFIEALHHDAQAQWGADLITGGLEELKAAMHATLRKLEHPDPPPATGADAVDGVARGCIHLLCDEKDRARKSTLPLRKWLRQQGFEVTLPAFEGDAAQVRLANQQLLASCDAVLLFYGAGDEGWKRTVGNELRKMVAYRDNRPLRASLTYLAEPRTSDKQDLIDDELPGLIDGLGGFDPAAMVPFIGVLAGQGARP